VKSFQSQRRPANKGKESGEGSKQGGLKRRGAGKMTCHFACQKEFKRTGGGWVLKKRERVTKKSRGGFSGQGYKRENQERKCRGGGEKKVRRKN